MATLTIMFPDDHGIELSVSFAKDDGDDGLMAGIELHSICLAGQHRDVSEWLSEFAIAVIERMIQREHERAYLCSIAVDYENAA